MRNVLSQHAKFTLINLEVDHLEKIFKAERRIQSILISTHHQTPKIRSNMVGVWQFRAFLLQVVEYEGGVANGIRTRNNKLHKLGLYH